MPDNQQMVQIVTALIKVTRSQLALREAIRAIAGSDDAALKASLDDFGKHNDELIGILEKIALGPRDGSV